MFECWKFLVGAWLIKNKNKVFKKSLYIKIRCCVARSPCWNTMFKWNVVGGLDLIPPITVSATHIYLIKLIFNKLLHSLRSTQRLDFFYIEIFTITYIIHTLHILSYPPPPPPSLTSPVFTNRRKLYAHFTVYTPETTRIDAKF